MEPAFQNDLRTALDRASAGGPSAPMGRMPALATMGSETAEASSPDMSMITPRLIIPRVMIKKEVAAYIESNFLARTNIDGSILRPSKEELIESLTGLFHMLEEQSGYIDEPKAKRGASSRGRQAES